MRQEQNSLSYNSHTCAQLVIIKKSTIFLEQTKLLSGCSNNTVLGVGFFTFHSYHTINCKASQTGWCSTVRVVLFCTTRQLPGWAGGGLGDPLHGAPCVATSQDWKQSPNAQATPQLCQRNAATQEERLRCRRENPREKRLHGIPLKRS